MSPREAGCVRSSDSRRVHAVAPVGRSRSPWVARHIAGVPTRSPAAQQGPPVPGRPTWRRRDRCRTADRWPPNTDSWEADAMRKLTFGMNLSLDGYIAAPGDDLGWSVPSDELFQ